MLAVSSKDEGHLMCPRALYGALAAWRVALCHFPYYKGSPLSDQANNKDKFDKTGKPLWITKILSFDCTY